MDTTLILILLIAGFIFGSLFTYFFAKSKFSKPVPFTLEEFVALKNEKPLLEQRINDLRLEMESFRLQVQSGNNKINSLGADLSRSETINHGLNEKLNTQRTELEDLQKKMKEQFENIAGKIIFDNSRLIQQQHSDKLNDLLLPFKEKIEKFENTVSNTHKENIRENQSLKEQLKLLQDLNKTIGDEARNLTTALKGQVKTQGNWGELILETILERSGLVKDREYFTQTSFKSDDGSRMLPDVLVQLPEGKTIIIDSKVSLTAYERFSSAEISEEREAAIKEHVISLKRHIKGLGEKKYQQLYDIKSLDFVLLFIPVEPAFNAAIQHDNKLFNDAFENNIVIVSTSTLFATLRIIASIWKLEYTNKNAQEISRQGGALYDKFVGFLEDLQKVGSSISASQKSWDGAMNKLSTGRGNLISSVQKIHKLGGIKATKTIPGSLINDDDEEQNIDNDESGNNDQEHNDLSK